MIIVAHNDRSFLFVSLCVHYTGGGNDGSGNENDATELALVDTTNDPQHAGEKEDEAGVLTRSGVDAEGVKGSRPEKGVELRLFQISRESLT